jgi:hypothetical protein
MGTIKGAFSEGRVVDSPLGQKQVDCGGAPIGGVRMEVSRAYAGIAGLLQKVINENDAAAWAKITGKIDYIYDNLDYALQIVAPETDLGKTVQARIRSGKKLLFKTNLVCPEVVDPITHGEGPGTMLCTEWPLIAALMRWFHDRLDITYHQMTMAEAASASFVFADLNSKISGRTITTEAVFEGRSGDFYGGWGFSFVRRYLSESHPAGHTDDPLKGFEDSVAGTFLPPGRAGDRLMVYDLNKIQVGSEPSRGRTVPVPDGANFQEIILHKAIVGGDPADPDDLRDYPGCVLVNVPKLKIHAQDLLTNAIKNLGIGLYPTMCASGDGTSERSWLYAYPPTSKPNYKGKLPHSTWVLKMDEATHLPVMDGQGEYIATRTKGFPGTQADVIRAVQHQGITMLHVVDAIEMINLSHNDAAVAVRIPEGYVWSSPDCVALDLFCARYCFKTLPMAEALKGKEENGWPTEFVHHVPVARVEGDCNIDTGVGLDSPLFRYSLYDYAARRQVGQQDYHVVGWDSLTETPLASLKGHLGRLEGETKFVELMTKTMYFNPTTILHDLQATILSYFRAHDQLHGSSLIKEFMDTFDENHDGILDYDEMGRKGNQTALFSMMAHATGITTEKYGSLKSGFILGTFFTKYGDEQFNTQGHDFLQELGLISRAGLAFKLSQNKDVKKDLFVPGMTFGQGCWPSWQTATYRSFTDGIYGSDKADEISLQSAYGAAFQYADKTLNGGFYTGADESMSQPDALDKYFQALLRGAPPLNFTLYVPQGYGTLGKVKLPNVEETADPRKIFTAHFNGGQEVW